MPCGVKSVTDPWIAAKIGDFLFYRLAIDVNIQISEFVWKKHVALLIE